MNHQIIAIIQIILGLLLTGLILLQSKGTGLGSTFGGDMGFYGTKRGAEKMLFILTIVTASLFLITSILAVFIVR
ncbi:preprotein translocase subunit SecG [Candidatus Daviesbacteria bacterium]|nr:preprotein translocase subunit SecG [Candidatus Daviesbacteria bacterium]